MKICLLILLIFTGQSLFSQPVRSADFMLFKQRHKTIGSYYAGNNIAFTSQQGNYLEAMITEIKHDSIFLRQFIVQQVPTNLGVYMLDTVASYRYQYSYKDIKAIGRTGRKFNTSASAASLMGGGLLLAVGSGIVFLADREKFSPQLFFGALGLGAVGYLMTKVSGKGMLIGKKYSLVYVAVRVNKKS